jgi:hypothetical protein
MSLLRHAETELPSARGLAALYRMLRPDDDAALWHSTINNDGTPFQIALADTGSPDHAVRLIIDPFRLGRDEADRMAANLAAFARLEGRCSARAARRCERFMAALAPSFTGTCDRRSGDIWLAADPGRAGIGIYVTAKDGPVADRAARLIAAAKIEQHREPIEAIHRACSIQAYSIQGSRSADLAVNIYWKPRPDAATLAQGIGFAVPLRRPGAAAGSLDHGSARALTLCSTFAVAGAQRSHKIDLCNHCLKLDTDQSLAVLEQFCAVTPEFADAVRRIANAGPAEIAFIGVRGKACGNTAYVYFKPASGRAQAGKASLA